MYILAIETTGPFGSVAVIDQSGAVVDERVSQDQMSHLKELLPMTAELLEHAGIPKTRLTHIAASVGPGSFTGIRIGVSTARALAQALNTEAVEVPTLESFMCKPEAKASEKVVCAILNARRGQVYGVIDGYMPPGPYMLADVIEVIKKEVLPDGKKVLFFGDGIDAYQSLICDELAETDFEFAAKGVRYQNAASVGKLAYEKVLAGETIPYGQLLPQYMRKAEAEQKLEAGQLPICRGPKQE